MPWCIQLVKDRVKIRELETYLLIIKSSFCYIILRFKWKNLTFKPKVVLNFSFLLDETSSLCINSLQGKNIPRHSGIGWNHRAHCNHLHKLLEFCEGSTDQKKGKWNISLWGNSDLAPHESSSKTRRIEFGSDYCQVGAQLIRKVIPKMWL